MSRLLPIRLAAVALLAGASAVSAADATTGAATLDTPAQAYYRQAKPAFQPTETSLQQKLDLVPKESVTKPKSLTARKPEAVQRLDEIRIYSYAQPEDYITPEKSPLLQMRDRLSSVHRTTPAEHVHNTLCMLGFCGGIPEEVSMEERREQRMRRNVMDSAQSSGGPLQ